MTLAPCRHNVKVISAAIVLGVDLLQMQGSEEDTATRALIDSALQQTETFAGVSVRHTFPTRMLIESLLTPLSRLQSVCRKGGGVVRFLLQKIDEESAQREQPRRSKRSRTFDYDVAQGRQMRSLSDAFAGSERTPATTDDDAEPRRRRAGRPPLAHSISDTNIPQAISPTEGILPGFPESGVHMTPSLSTGRQQTLRPESAHSAPGTPSESTFPSYSTAPVGRQIAGLGRTGFGQSRSKLSAGPHSAGLSIELPSPLMATVGNPHQQRGPVSTSPPQYNMNVHLGSTTPAGPPPAGEDGTM